MRRNPLKICGCVLFGVVLAVVTASESGCAKAAEEKTVLQADDLAADEGTKFDRNKIVDSASFTDTLGIDADLVKRFLQHTPYKRPSFLGTYQSNGIRAVDAIMRSSTKYRINPLVFLVRLEMAQGLVGEQFSPFPPARVEYVFGCGCTNANVCQPSLAGLDKQLDCLGRALRTSLDEIKATGATAGGWGPGRSAVTADGQKVIPADDSTATLYQYMPLVGFGKSGNWLFWNIWQKYAQELEYQPTGGPAVGSAWIGDPCTTDQLCDGYSSGLCANDPKDSRTPGGMCTFDCTKQDCPSDADHAKAFCAEFSDGVGRCLLLCNPDAPACRAGYTCKPGVHRFGDPDPQAKASVCFN